MLGNHPLLLRINEKAVSHTFQQHAPEQALLPPRWSTTQTGNQEKQPKKQQYLNTWLIQP